MTLDKDHAFRFAIDEDNADIADIDRCFTATRGLIERIVEAENIAFKNKIEANAVVVNGRKYGVLNNVPGLMPTVFGMRLETPVDMPDEWDFYIQQRPPQPKTNADRIRAMSDEELARYIANLRGWLVDLEVLDWLKSPYVEAEE